MKLTKKESIKRTEELWTWLAETGEEYRVLWPSWNHYSIPSHGGYLCDYASEKSKLESFFCGKCPYFQKFGDCTRFDSPYSGWVNAETIDERKKYAKLLLEELRQLK